MAHSSEMSFNVTPPRRNALIEQPQARDSGDLASAFP